MVKVSIKRYAKDLHEWVTDSFNRGHLLERPLREIEHWDERSTEALTSQSPSLELSSLSAWYCSHGIFAALSGDAIGAQQVRLGVAMVELSQLCFIASEMLRGPGGLTATTDQMGAIACFYMGFQDARRLEHLKQLLFGRGLWRFVRGWDLSPFPLLAASLWSKYERLPIPEQAEKEGIHHDVMDRALKSLNAVNEEETIRALTALCDLHVECGYGNEEYDTSWYGPNGFELLPIECLAAMEVYRRKHGRRIIIEHELMKPVGCIDVTAPLALPPWYERIWTAVHRVLERPSR